MKKLYTWTEDGEMEPVLVASITVHEDALCYHCNKQIPAGSAAVKLLADDGDIYILHESCTKSSLSDIPYTGWDEPANIMRKAAVLKDYIADLKYLKNYYGPVFINDPWINEQIAQAEAEFAAMDEKYRARVKRVIGYNGKTGEEMGVSLCRDLMTKQKEINHEYYKGN